MKNSMTQIIIFPRGQLCEEDKANLRNAGVVPVEVDDPSKVVQLIPGSTLVTGDDLLMSALWEIERNSGGDIFLKELRARLRAKEQSNE